MIEKFINEYIIYFCSIVVRAKIFVHGLWLEKILSQNKIRMQ